MHDQPTGTYLDPAIPTCQLAEPQSNPNSMTDVDFALLVQAIREEGFADTIVVRALTTPTGTDQTVYEVIDGVHRLRACREAGIETMSAYVYPEGTCSDAKAKALQVGRNKLRGTMNLTEVARGLSEAGVGEAGFTHLAGYTEADFQDLVGLLTPTEAEDLLADDIAPPTVVEEPEPQEAAPAVFELTVTFSSVDDLKNAKRLLAKAAPGRSRDLAKGLKAVLGL